MGSILDIQLLAYETMSKMGDDESLILFINELHRINNLEKLISKFHDEAYQEASDLSLSDGVIKQKDFDRNIKSVKIRLLQQERYKELRYYFPLMSQSK